MFNDDHTAPLDGLFASFNSTTLPWTNLGLQPFADQALVKSKRKEVLMIHPDKNLGDGPQSNEDFVRAHNAFSYMMSNAGPDMRADPVHSKVDTAPLLIEWHKDIFISAKDKPLPPTLLAQVPSFQDFLRRVPTAPRPRTPSSSTTSPSFISSTRVYSNRSRPRPLGLHISSHATLIRYLRTTTLLLCEYRDLLQALYEVLLIDIGLPFASPQVFLTTGLMADATKLCWMLAGLKEWLSTLHRFGKGYWIQHIGEVGRLEGQIVELWELVNGNMARVEDCLARVQIQGSDVACVDEMEVLRERVRGYCGREVDFAEG